LCIVFLTAFTLLVTGCATTQGPKTTAQRVDPWENWNRKVFSFNDTLDEAVLKPVATAYTKVVPQVVRRGVSNFFGNFSDAWSAVNNMLQGKVGDGLQDVMRVGTNTLFGLGGFIDVASEAGLDRHNEDFGQTLGRWGFSTGPYVVWPLLGPSTVRESFALPLDRYVSPALAVTTDIGQIAVLGVGFVNERANLLSATRVLDDIALDKYTFVRDAYLQRRRSLVYDGNVPDSPSDDEPPADESTSTQPSPDAGAPAKPADAPASAASQAGS
jgi:phospholipid-binding lipoprotein MlaA